MALVERNTVMIEERDKEIVTIVQSISEINEMYRDLATMVVDQVGTVFLLKPFTSNGLSLIVATSVLRPLHS